ncbi:MAG TPA: antibiotic biosynthesis monooxygenase [Roseiarcus sp.]|nr:antibiotic biosynthesis monooxygenase [Roseiarcus sp.]
MIIREWRGRAETQRANAYPKHFREKVASELRSISGFLGADLVRREVGDRIEFVVLTRWRSIEAIRAFAGPDAERAVVEPEAVAALSDFDEFVRHYESIERVSAP